MQDIEKYDKNLVVETTITEPDLVWFNVRELPFELHGLLYDEEMGCFIRMPQKVAEGVSAGVSGSLNRCTAGGRVRFRTNSSFIGIKAVMQNAANMPHITLAGQSGFDLYRVEKTGFDTFYRTFMPIRGMKEGYSAGHYTGGIDTDYTINFPLYDGVKELYIALKKGAKLGAPTPYRDVPPVVYYGSSITQGGCASRPGNAYQAIITRETNVDHINLGFSGSAKGEPAMAEYIKGLDMSVFVYDYDHNCNGAAHLKETHHEFYRIIREAHPDLPIIMITSSTILLKEQEFAARREVIIESYKQAVAEGDQNVYFIDGKELFVGDNWDACTVDGVHPNDLGFYRMAKRIGRDVKAILNKTVK